MSKMEDIAAMLERRQYPRLDYRCPVIVRHQGKLIPGLMSNVSCGGMRIIADEDFIDNAPVEIIFDLNHIARDVSLRGDVVRIEDSFPKAIGVKFVDATSSGHKTIEQFLTTRIS
ncbi:MAG: PilZ domain-containing protein [Deltaproteobacteria bacterium]|nr:PilZ domain-containing protein [Deltaproteobacteria bacterium]